MTGSAVMNHLRYLELNEPVYATYGWGCWLEVEAEVNRLTLKSELTDVILRPLLRKREAGAGRSADILLLLCWRSLLAIHYLVKSYECDQLDRWSDLTWHFMEVLHRFNLSARPDHIGRKIFNDTKTNLVEQYESERQRHQGVGGAAESDEDDGDPERELARAPGASIEFATADLRIQRTWIRARLHRLVEEGHLTRPQYFALLGRHLHGDSMFDLGTRLGIQEEAAKKHYQRAVENLKNFAPTLSPNAADTPLYPVGRVRTERKRHGM